MKKVSGIFLIIVILCPVISCYLQFKIQQWYIREEMEHTILCTVSEKYQDILSVKTGEAPLFSLEPGGRELQYKGDMYDIVRTDTVQGTIRYHCIKDTKETQLLARYETLLQKETESSTCPMGKTQQRLLKVFLSLVYLPSKQQYIIAGVYCPYILTTSAYHLSTAEHCSEIPAPPPRCS
ncbi:hypothetical protein ACTHGU_08685 [Chitinophagaceae bacterium MMS25-I14]